MSWPNITLTPATEWPVIEAESATTGELLTGYALPLAAIGAVAAFIGSSLVGTTVPFVGTYRAPFVSGIVAAVFGLGMALVMCFLLSLIIDALAPTFNGQKNQIQALKLAVYSFTPAWLAGVLRIVPLLGIFILFAALYSIYVLYLGIPRLMKSPQDKALPYTAVVVVCAIVMGFIVAAISGIFIGGAMLTSGALSSNTRSSSEVQFDKNSPMGKLQEIAKSAEASSKKMAGRLPSVGALPRHSQIDRIAMLSEGEVRSIAMERARSRVGCKAKSRSNGRKTTVKMTSQEDGWRRLIVEKPFGYDLGTAKALNHVIHAAFEENQVYQVL